MNSDAPGSGRPFDEGTAMPDRSAVTVDPLSRIRHDLRTPASHIQGYAEMLREESIEDWAAPCLPDLRRIEEAGRRLVTLIRDELSPERVASGRIDLRELQADLRTPLNHVLGYSEILLERFEDRPECSFVRDLQKIQAAARTFLRLMGELLVPANLGLERAAETVTEPAPVPRSTAEPGAFALARPTAAGEGMPAVRESAGGTLLVVDDDASNRELLQRRLSRQGFEVLVAEDGPAALSLLAGCHVDLVLLDLIMPGMNGDEVLARIKGDPDLREIPVIMLSAIDEMDSVVRCLLMGAEDYLSKPFNSVLLRARLDTCLEKRRLRRLEASHLDAIETERRKSESLLLNILPQAIATRLKQGETTIVDSLAGVTVLFADLVGFTELSSRLSSVGMVRLLDDVFSAFDLLARARGLEKIKTIGDAYMVVGGLPMPRPDHAEAIAELALDMLVEVDRLFAAQSIPMQLRLGMHSGPVIAGIIGRHKFNYDLWGDTVNTASRMESHGAPGRIQITETTRALLGDRYVFESRGEIEVKGKGRMATWFLVSRKG